MTAFFGVYLDSAKRRKALRDEYPRRKMPAEKIKEKSGTKRGIGDFRYFAGLERCAQRAGTISLYRSPIFGMVGCFNSGMVLVYKVPALHKYKGAFVVPGLLLPYLLLCVFRSRILFDIPCIAAVVMFESKIQIHCGKVLSPPYRKK